MALIRVLQVFHMMGNGGIEHYVMDIYRHIDRTKVQFDFLTSDAAPGFFDEEIKSLGGKLYKAYPLKKNPIKCYQDIARIVRENGYSIVHRHTGSAFGYFELHAAKHGGAKRLILHAHATKAENEFLHLFSKTFMPLKCERLACSEQAGKYLFGSKQFHVMRNTIDCDAYKFNAEMRDEIRNDLGLNDKFVVGHVGRFGKAKNHAFLIQVFAQLIKKEKNAVLVCVGDGELLPSAKTLCEQLGIENSVLFLGNRSDVSSIVNACDVFCLPSLDEGFGITLLEAQANGLQCIASDVIPRETNISENVSFVSLKESPEVWANVVLLKTGLRDDLAIEKVKKQHFDINTEAKKIELFYSAFLEGSNQ